MLDISIVIPVYNCELALNQVLTELILVLKKSGLNYEIILVNDNSSDSSQEIITGVCQADKRVKAVHLKKNQGQQKSILVGLSIAAGKYIVIMDDDGQNNPSDIIILYDTANKGYDLVFGSYRKYQHTLFRKLISRLVKKFVRYIFSAPKEISISNYKIMNLRLAKIICLYARSSPFINGEALLYAESPVSILVNHRESLLNGSRYSYKKLFGVFFDVFFNYSFKPLRLIISISLVISISSLIFSIFILYFYLSRNNVIPGWTSIMIFISFYFSAIFLCLGVICEFLARRSFESKDKRTLALMDLSDSINI